MKTNGAHDLGSRPTPGDASPRRRDVGIRAVLAAGAVALLCTGIALSVILTGSGDDVSARQDEAASPSVDDYLSSDPISLLATQTTNTTRTLPLWSQTTLGAYSDELVLEQVHERVREISEEGTPSHVALDVPAVYQLPELPCGCEITAAAAAVEYLGYDVTNVGLNDFLVQGWDIENPHEGFIGYCASSGWMCYVEPVASAVNSYFASIGDTSHEAVDVTGTDAATLYDEYIAEGIPVTVWVTTYLQDRDIVQSWTVDGEEVSVSEQDHAMTLAGYTADEVVLMDPLVGDVVTYPRKSFENAYAVRGYRAMVILPR